MTTEHLPVPQEDELIGRIAAQVPGADPAMVRDVLAAHGIHLTSPLPVRRELVVHYVYCDGTKSGTDDNDGPFTLRMRLGAGPWAIASTINSAGKSSLLWALSFALRGEGFDEFCRPETVGWFSYVRADIEVAGVPASIRLTFDRAGHPSATLLTADTVASLLGLEDRQESGPGVRTAARAEPEGVKQLIDRFMLDRLGLKPVYVWTAEPGAPKDADGQRDSREDRHGWASFFYGVALNSASGKVLLGPTTYGQLPVKLMQLFLDVPYASELSQLTTARKKDTQESNRVVRRAKEDAQARHDQAEPLRLALETVQGRLQSFQTSKPDLTRLLAGVDSAARQVAACQRTHQEAEEHRAAARKDRLADERAVRRARQSSAARLLLGALDPETCPRCETVFDDDRRKAEDSRHVCSLCTNDLPEQPAEDPEAQAAALSRLDDRLNASRTAEKTAQAALDAAAKALDQSRAAYNQASRLLEAARSADWYTQFESAQQELYQLQGALAVAEGTSSAMPAVVGEYIEAGATPTAPPSLDDSILGAAADVLSPIVAEHSRSLFAELNEEIVTLAQRLGVTNLTSVNLSLNGNVNAKKSGARHRFSAFSPTERLRMRIATVVSMITVGRRRGIMSHPGLLLIDAPTAEELVAEHARATLQTLYDTASTVPGMQIVITSIEDAVWDTFPADRIVTGHDSRQLF
ncbi:hypothetical protein ABZW10_17920 [Kitasatospora sp. NPDC004723]|uniref:hypothetical protein n=1 Tax=Kitasatospora sp. NPDC004723 TaxID=3154288 RepID=UPI0033B9B342